MATLDPAGDRLRQTKRRSLGRDIWVNFLANILAAAPIWLVGQATGVVAKNPTASSVALGVISAGLIGASLAIGDNISGKPRQVLLVCAASTASYGVILVNNEINPAANELFLWVNSIAVAFLFMTGYTLKALRDPESSNAPWYIWALAVMIALVASAIAGAGFYLAGRYTVHLLN